MFLDRDGTLCEDYGPLRRFEDMAIFPYTYSALHNVLEMGFELVVVTNQAAIAKGLITLEDVQTTSKAMVEHFRLRGIKVLDSLFCPHHPDGVVAEYSHSCGCRKPMAGMLLDAAAAHDICLAKSVMVGDNITDIIAGQRAGCRFSLLVLTGHGHAFRTAHSGPILRSIEELPEFLRTVACS